MNISAPFIDRPVATTLLTLALLLAGALGLSRCCRLRRCRRSTFRRSRSALRCPARARRPWPPRLPRRWSGSSAASPASIEMTSSSQLGSTGITMQFDLNRNIDAAARDVQAAINAARGYLPANLPSNPTYRKINPADSPDHDSGADVRRDDAGPDVRRRRLHHGAEVVSGRGRGPGFRRRDRRSRRFASRPIRKR